MGYCVDMIKSTIGFKLKNTRKIMDTLKDLEDRREERFSWIQRGSINDAEDFIEVMSAIRYPVTTDEERELLVIDYFRGEKLGDDLEIFKAIAPYVEPGYIEYRGEDGETWRYLFENEEVKVVSPATIWQEKKDGLTIKDVLTEENIGITFKDNQGYRWTVCRNKKINTLTLGLSCDSYQKDSDIAHMFGIPYILDLRFIEDDDFSDSIIIG